MKISLRRRHTLMVEDGAFSHKIDYLISKGIQIALLVQGLQQWWILPIGGASAVEGLRSTGLPRLVYIHSNIFIFN